MLFELVPGGFLYQINPKKNMIQIGKKNWDLETCRKNQKMYWHTQLLTHDVKPKRPKYG